MSEFEIGYLTAALWSTLANHPDDPDADHTFEDMGYEIDDIAPATLAQMTADCTAFMEANAEALLIDGAPSLEVAGHDFWLTREGHGAGFWDGDWPEPAGAQLTKSAKAFGSFELYLGDDDLIYAMGYETEVCHAQG